MRFIHALLTVACLLAGCHTKDAPDDAKPAAMPAPRSARGGGLGPAPVPAATATNATSAVPVVLPASGRVHLVNAGLRFVVIDYTLGGMPTMGSLLRVYRGNEQVGQIRLSGPEPRNGFVTGDIVEGILQVDDEVRLN